MEHSLKKYSSRELEHIADAILLADGFDVAKYKEYSTNFTKSNGLIWSGVEDGLNQPDFRPAVSNGCKSRSTLKYVAGDTFTPPISIQDEDEADDNLLELEHQMQLDHILRYKGPHKETLVLLLEGKTSAQIQDALQITRRAVNLRRAKIREYLSVVYETGSNFKGVVINSIHFGKTKAERECILLNYKGKYKAELQLMLDGKSTTEIGEHLGLKRWAVWKHKKSIMTDLEKLLCTQYASNFLHNI